MKTNHNYPKLLTILQPFTGNFSIQKDFLQVYEEECVLNGFPFPSDFANTFLPLLQDLEKKGYLIRLPQKQTYQLHPLWTIILPKSSSEKALQKVEKAYSELYNKYAESIDVSCFQTASFDKLTVGISIIQDELSNFLKSLFISIHSGESFFPQLDIIDKYFKQLEKHRYRISLIKYVLEKVFYLEDKHELQIYEQGQSYTLLGEAYYGENRLKEALEAFECAIQLFDELEIENIGYAVAIVLANISSVYNDLRRFEEAIENYHKAATIFKKEYDLDNLEITFRNIGLSYYEIFKLNKAIQYCEKALQIARELEDYEKMARNYQYLALIYARKKEYPKALELNRKVLELPSISERPFYRAEIYQNEGLIFGELKKWKEANRRYRQAMEIYLALEDRSKQADILNNLAYIAKNQHLYLDAEKYFNNALNIYESLEDEAKTAMVFQGLGAVKTDMEEFEEAEFMLSKAIQIYNQLGDLRSVAENLLNICSLNISRKNFLGSQDSLLAASKISKQLDNPQFLGKIYLGWGETYRGLGEISKARENYLKSIDHFLPGTPESAVEAYLQLAEIYKDTNDPEISRKYFNKALKLIKHYQLSNKLTPMYIRIAIFEDEKKRYDKAIEVLLEGLEELKRLPENFQDQIAKIHILVGLLNFGLEQLTEAEDHFKLSKTNWEEMDSWKNYALHIEEFSIENDQDSIWPFLSQIWQIPEDLLRSFGLN